MVLLLALSVTGLIVFSSSPLHTYTLHQLQTWAMVPSCLQNARGILRPLFLPAQAGLEIVGFSSSPQANLRPELHDNICR